MTRWTPVICQPWLDYERGEGSRPGGYTLHLTQADRIAYLAEFYANRQPRDRFGMAPDFYTQEVGGPYTVLVDEEVAELVYAKHGVVSFKWAPKPGTRITMEQV